MSSITRHEIYYFEDGNLILLAETTLFNVHISHFMFSPFFQEILSLPQSADGPLQGSSDSNPIDIGGSDVPAELAVASITAEDFSDFLSVMFPMTYQGGLVRSAESWGRVLKTSTMLQFEPIRAMAIMNLLPTADPLLMIELGIDHYHEPLVVEGIKRLSLCLKPIPFDAAFALSPVTFYHLVTSREAIRKHLTRKVMDDAFNSWQCSGAKDGWNNTHCAKKIQSQLSKLIIPQSTPNDSESLATNPTDETKAFHDIAKETLRRSKRLCDRCFTSWDTQIERLADFSEIDEIIKNTIKETPNVASRGLKHSSRFSTSRY